MNIFRKYYAFVQSLQNFTNFLFCFVWMVFFVLDLFCQGWSIELLLLCTFCLGCFAFLLCKKKPSAEGLGFASAHFLPGFGQSPYPGKKKRCGGPRRSLGPPRQKKAKGGKAKTRPKPGSMPS